MLNLYIKFPLLYFRSYIYIINHVVICKKLYVILYLTLKVVKTDDIFIIKKITTIIIVKQTIINVKKNIYILRKCYIRSY